MTKRVIKKHGENEILAIKVRDKATQRVSVLLCQRDADGNLSTPVSVSKSMLKNGTKCLEALYDLECGVETAEDLEEIQNSLLSLLSDQSISKMEVEETASPDLVYMLLAEYIREQSDRSAIVDVDGILKYEGAAFIKDGRGFLKTTFFNEFLKSNEVLSTVKRKTVLLQLKMMGVLIQGNRVYDMKIRIGKHTDWFYVIKMPDITSGIIPPDQEIDLAKGGD